jgi:predicted porin
MKKSLLALAVLGAFVGTASAQSSVTLFGTVDVSGRYVKTDGVPRRLTENSNALNSSRFGIRGEEDLGGGLKAGFLLESEVGSDSGGSGDPSRNKFLWNRSSLVRLWGNWGEIRLGRDGATPSFWNLGIFDAFGTLGLGNLLNVRQMYGGTRMDNSIGYILPSNLGGFYGQAMVAASEGGASFDRPGRYYGARLGYSAGPINVAVGAGNQRFDTAFILGTNGAVVLNTGGVFAGRQVPYAAGDVQKTINIGASYDFGVVKVTGLYDREQLSAKAAGGDRRENVFNLGVVVPLGVGEIHAAYSRSKLTPGVAIASSKLDQIALGYVYNLSKRTALYTTVSRLDNKDATFVTLPGSAPGAITAGGKSQGAEFGIRHFF